MDVSHLISVTSKTNALLIEQSKVELSRIRSPMCKYTGYVPVPGDKDGISGHEVMTPTSTKLPLIDKIPPYTTWIFLDRYEVSPPIKLMIK